jgi:hypothetical protein
MTNDERMTNDEARSTKPEKLRPSTFVIRASFDIRHSSFDIPLAGDRQTRRDAMPQPTPSRPNIDPTQPTCGQFPVLAILELACRDSRQRPLLLSGDLETDDLRRHLEEERCPLCLRWYHNACRAYQASVSTLPWIARVAGESRSGTLAAWGKLSIVRQPLAFRPPRGCTGLDTLRGVLVWSTEGHGEPDGPTPQRWLVTLQFPSLARDLEHGNPEPALQRFDGSRARLKLMAAKPAKPWNVRTRLDWDAHEQQLATHPESVLIDNPEKVETIKFFPGKRIPGFDLT